MMPWPQVYDPTGSAFLSTLLAALPIVVLLGALGLLGWSAPRAAFAGLATALGVAIVVYGMPWESAVASAGYGAASGFSPSAGSCWRPCSCIRSRWRPASSKR